MLKVSLENIREMTEIGTIVGNPIKNLDNVIAIPISRVKMTFASGGSDYNSMKEQPPFGGGTGGSVSVTPVAFLVMSNGEIKIMHMQNETHILEQIIEKVPEAINKLRSAQENKMIN